ncbi:MAG: hypothetical protein ACI4AB_10990 [Acetatifactor sp.]
MTKRKICGFLSGVMLAATLTGCGDGSEEVSSQTSDTFGMPEAVHMETTPVLAQPEQSANEMKLLYNTGKLTEEEEAAVQDAMESLYRNLDVEEYLGESIHMVSSEEWFETMSPRLYEGCRSYTLQQGEEILLSVQVGYDISGKPYSNVCYQADENSVSLLKQADSKVSLMQTGISDGEYDGEFVTWQIDGEQGEIKKEQGTYSQGVLVGEYIVSVYQGAAGDVFDLWTNRENMVYETKTMTYDDKGQLIAEPTPEPTAAPTKAPAATQKPAVTPKPVQTPAPTVAPTQPPAHDDDDDDDDDDNHDNGGGDSGSGDSGGDNGGDSDSSGSTEGDTDIEWSPDLM